MGGLHERITVVDCHNDIPQILVLRPLLGDVGTLRNHWLEELRQGGINVQVMPVSAEGSSELALRSTLRQLAATHREIQANLDSVQLCLDGSSIREAVAAGRIAMVLAMEGASALGDDPDLVRLFDMMGVRIISFTHLGRSFLADGSGEDATGSRLTRAGVGTLREIERHGILFDVTHLGQAGVSHVLELATRPVIATHSVARALHDHHRNLIDEHLAGIASTGGVVCANAVPGFVDPTNPTLDRMVDHIEHMVEIAGIEHVGLGADFCSEIFKWAYSDASNLMIEGIDARQKLDNFWAARHTPLLTQALEGRGFTEDEIRAIMGENLLRLFDVELGVPKDVPAYEAPPALR